MALDITNQFSGMTNEQIAEMVNAQVEAGNITREEGDLALNAIASMSQALITMPAVKYDKATDPTLIAPLFSALNFQLEAPKPLSASNPNISKLLNIDLSSLGQLSIDDIGVALLLIGQQGRTGFIKSMQSSVGLAKEASYKTSEKIRELQKVIANEQKAVEAKQKSITETANISNKIGFWASVACAVAAVALACVCGGPLLIIGAVCAVVGVLTSVASQGLAAKAKGETGFMASIGTFSEKTIGAAVKGIASLVGKDITEADGASIGLTAIGLLAAIGGLCCSFSGLKSVLDLGTKASAMASSISSWTSIITSGASIITGGIGVYTGIQNIDLTLRKFELEKLSIQKEKDEMEVDTMNKTLETFKGKLNEFINSMLDIEKMVSEEFKHLSNTKSEIISTI